MYLSESKNIFVQIVNRICLPSVLVVCVTSSEQQSMSLVTTALVFVYVHAHMQHMRAHPVPLCADKHCTRCGDPEWMWTSRKKRLNTLATRRKKSWTTRDEAHTGRTWRYGSRVVRGVKRDVTGFKTCDTLPVRDTLAPFTGGQVFRVKRDVIRQPDIFESDCSTRWRVLNHFCGISLTLLLVLMPSGIIIYPVYKKRNKVAFNHYQTFNWNLTLR